MGTLRIGGLTAGPPPVQPPTLRVGGLRATGTIAPSTSTFRIGGLGAFGTPRAGSTLRVGAITATGPVASRAVLRVGGIRASGALSIGLQTFAEIKADPFDTVTLNAVLISGGPAVSYTWRQIIGPTVALAGIGGKRTFAAPAGVDPSTIIIGVTATDGAGVTSAEVRATIQIAPHTIYLNDGTGFKPVPLISLPLPVPVDTTPPPTSVSGLAMPTGPTVSDGYNWTPTTLQDFTTDAPLGGVRAAYPSMAFYTPGSLDTSNQGKYDDARTLSVANSQLDVWQHIENGQAWGAVILPDAYASHLYGRFDMRFKVASQDPGYKLVPMLWPSSDDWNDGEIDWPEAELGDRPRPASAVPGTYANGGMTFLPGYDAYAATNMLDWHTSSTRWTPKGIYFYWDGVPVISLTDPTKNPTKPMRVTLQHESWIRGPANARTPVPAGAQAHTKIDWIAIYALGSPV